MEKQGLKQIAKSKFSKRCSNIPAWMNPDTPFLQYAITPANPTGKAFYLLNGRSKWLSSMTAVE